MTLAVFVLVFVCLESIAVTSFESQHYTDQNHQRSDLNELACPYETTCVPVNYCPDVESLMNHNAVSIHRFRLAVCGYEGTTLKICCGFPRDMTETERGMKVPKSECGKSFMPNSYLSPMTLGSFPFLARIEYINVNTGETKYPCTGTIIDARTIMTTATCALSSSDDYKLQSIVVGEYDTATDPDCNSMFCGHTPVAHKISYVVKHPRFNADTFANNIALIRLQEAINFTATVQPICIYTDTRQYSFLKMEKNDLLFGWGKLFGEKNGSSELRALNMRLVAREECAAEFAESRRGLCIEMCAIAEYEPCDGFSGSPLIRVDRNNRYVMIGMLSYGSTCQSNRNSPVAFIAIERYADWITQN